MAVAFVRRPAVCGVVVALLAAAGGCGGGGEARKPDAGDARVDPATRRLMLTGTPFLVAGLNLIF